ncbi:MAG TPA: carboxypeptidase-like regulatory domain-containing protein [Nitrososphaeraceae archaeon]|jgi:hypothetical protein
MIQSPSTVHGVVKDNNNMPILGARVSFVSGPVPLPDIAALADLNGTFVLSAPVPGDYVIEVVSEGFAANKTRISIENNQEYTIEINLSRQES